MLDLSMKLASSSLNTPITLLRARATTLAFSLLPTTSRARQTSKSGVEDDDDDEDDEEEGEGEADPDVLPMLLAYKDGELERKWIRVDWDIGQGDLEGLLRRYVRPIHHETTYDTRLEPEADFVIVRVYSPRRAMTIDTASMRRRNSLNWVELR